MENINKYPIYIALIISLVLVCFACMMPAWSMPWLLVIIAAFAAPVFAYMWVCSIYEEAQEEKKGERR